MYKNLKIGTKLIIVFLVIGLFPLGIISWISLSNAKSAITDIMEEQLAYVRNVKKGQVEEYFSQKITEMNMLAKSADVAIAYRGFNAYSEDWDILPEGEFDVSYEDYQSIVNEKCRVFENYVREYGYEDLYLIHGDYGHVMYSVEKGKDLGANLATGQYKKSALAKIWKRVKENQEPAISDYEKYLPLNNAPTMFIGSPLLDANDKVISVIAIRVNQKQIDTFLQDRDGMGETGEAYLVGRDKKFRSNLASQDNTILDLEVSDDIAATMFTGTAGTSFVNNYQGNDVLSTYSPLDLVGLDWFVITEVSTDEVFEAISNIQITIIVVSVILAGLVFLIGMFMSRSISKPIRQVVKLTHVMNDEFAELASVVDAIANNDLSLSIEDSKVESVVINSRDELGELMMSVDETFKAKNHVGQSMKKMLMNLNNMIKQIKNNATNLVDVASRVAESSERIATGAKDQSCAVDQVSTAMEEMAATSTETFNNTKEATTISENSYEIANSGGRTVGDAIDGMCKIDKVVNESSGSINKLSESAAQIGEIVTTINDIADQTNLLALNAAIEAARAGEQGRGFAVVADEVRKLAERTGTATGEIARMIETIQGETQEAVRSMEAGTTEVNNGQGLVDKAGKSLQEIVGMSEQVGHMIGQIAAASKEQSDAASDISTNVDQFSVTIKNMTEEAVETSKTSQELNTLASSLDELVSKFEITV